MAGSANAAIASAKHAAKAATIPTRSWGSVIRRNTVQRPRTESGCGSAEFGIDAQHGGQQHDDRGRQQHLDDADADAPQPADETQTGEPLERPAGTDRRRAARRCE